MQCLNLNVNDIFPIMFGLSLITFDADIWMYLYKNTRSIILGHLKVNNIVWRHINDTLQLGIICLLPILQKRIFIIIPILRKENEKKKHFIWNSISFQIDYINAFVKRFTHKSFNRIEAQTTNKVVKIVPFWEFGVLFCQPDTLLRQLASPFHLPCHKDE